MTDPRRAILTTATAALPGDVVADAFRRFGLPLAGSCDADHDRDARVRALLGVSADREGRRWLRGIGSGIDTRQRRRLRRRLGRG